MNPDEIIEKIEEMQKLVGDSVQKFGGEKAPKFDTLNKDSKKYSELRSAVMKHAQTELTDQDGKKITVAEYATDHLPESFYKAKSQNGRSVVDASVILSAEHGKSKLFKDIFDAGVDVLEYIPIYIAYSGNTKWAKQNGFLDVQDGDGKTALHYAAEDKRILHREINEYGVTESYSPGLEAARALVKAGADVNTRAKDGKSPLDLATGSKNKQMETFLNTKHAFTGELLEASNFMVANNFVDVLSDAYKGKPEKRKINSVQDLFPTPPSSGSNTPTGRESPNPKKDQGKTL